MARNTIKIIAVGRLRAGHFKTAAAYYMKRLGHWREIHERIIADADSALPPAERIRLEGSRINAAIAKNDMMICLDERGEALTSRGWARLLDQVSADANQTPCFVLGGAFGLCDTARAQARHLISFGPMTLPHELARVVLLEQLYRAQTILSGLPYHHE